MCVCESVHVHMYVTVQKSNTPLIYLTSIYTNSASKTQMYIRTYTHVHVNVHVQIATEQSTYKATYRLKIVFFTVCSMFTCCRQHMSFL